jgi:diguanylate cyclase (GGDEF)-like protein
LGLWHKLIQSISFSVATPEGRQRLEPLDFALRVAVLVTAIAVIIDMAGLFILSKFGLVTDLVNGLMLGVTLTVTTAFSITLLVCWLNAREVKLLAQSHERFLHLSHTDALTGLNNRLGLYANCVNLDTQYCVAFFDIDHFKSVNDRYGHLAGDMVISSVATIIRDSFDETEHVARLGGEEFVVVQALAPQYFLEECERVRARIAASAVDFQGMRINTTVSIGVAFRENWEIFERVLHNADTALYEAKRTGRNRVCLAGHKVSRQTVA